MPMSFGSPPATSNVMPVGLPAASQPPASPGMLAGFGAAMSGGNVASQPPSMGNIAGSLTPLQSGPAPMQGGGISGMLGQQLNRAPAPAPAPMGNVASPFSGRPVNSRMGRRF